MSEEINAMLKYTADTLSQFGVNKLQIGSTTVSSNREISTTELKGYGDTVKAGDIVYIGEANSKDYLKGTDGVDAIYRIGNISPDQNDPWMWFTSVTCNPTSVNYKGGGWVRHFKLVPEEKANQFREWMKWEHLSVRVYFSFPQHSAKYETKRYLQQNYHVPVPLILYYNGDIRKAAVHDSPYGSIYRKTLKLKYVTGWKKTCIFDLDGMIPVPNDLPFSLE